MISETMTEPRTCQGPYLDSHFPKPAEVTGEFFGRSGASGHPRPEIAPLSLLRAFP